MAAQAGCTAFDVASILAKKRQLVTSYEVAVTGEQREDRHPHVHERIEIVHELTGPELDTEAVRRSIEASATRYCTVSAMFSAGPDENPDALGTRYRSPADLPAHEGAA